MTKLIINVPGMPAAEVELKPGVNRAGRSRNNDLQISHPSISSVHCEIIDNDGALTVRDLGSTNGTTLDGQPAADAPFQPGQLLRLGEVGITFAAQSAGIPAQDAAQMEGETPSGGAAGIGSPPPDSLPAESNQVTGKPRLAMVSRSAAPPSPPLAPRLAVNPVKPKPRVAGFYQSIPSAFVYPFRGNGLILLLSGTVFFVVLNFVGNLPFAGLLGTLFVLCSSGYLFAFVKSIITTSAMGELEPPSWPDFESWTETGLFPFFQMAALFLVCLGPAIFYHRYAAPAQPWVTAVLLIGGLLYLPMALLGVAIYDSLLALNPVLIILSMLRVPLQYAATCAVLAFLAAMVSGSNWVDENLKVPLLPTIVDEFLLLYSLMAMARLVGVLYFTTKARLAWKLG